MQTYFFYFVIF